jgi:SAM-dependent methyltransferase
MAEFKYSGRELEGLANLPHYYDWIVDCFRPYLRGAGIEFGAGLGTISGRVRPWLDALDLVEPSPDMVPALKQRFAGDVNVRVFHANQEDHVKTCAAPCYDVVVMVNVLEHIENDQAALNDMHRLLRPGGRLLLFVPALRFLYSEFDRRVGHYRRYHLDELSGRVGAAGFSIVAARYFDIAGVLPWWLFNTVGGQVDFNPFVVKVFDNAVVPVLRRIERWMRPPFGKNILLVAEKD